MRHGHIHGDRKGEGIEEVRSIFTVVVTKEVGELGVGIIEVC